jgi:hypothetical protein
MSLPQASRWRPSIRLRTYASTCRNLASPARGRRLWQPGRREVRPGRPVFAEIGAVAAVSAISFLISVDLAHVGARSARLSEGTRARSPNLRGLPPGLRAGLLALSEPSLILDPVPTGMSPSAPVGTSIFPRATKINPGQSTHPGPLESASLVGSSDPDGGVSGDGLPPRSGTFRRALAPRRVESAGQSGIPVSPRLS